MLEPITFSRSLDKLAIVIWLLFKFNTSLSWGPNDVNWVNTHPAAPHTPQTTVALREMGEIKPPLTWGVPVNKQF